jgi:origin recognition complex subunit 3
MVTSICMLIILTFSSDYRSRLPIICIMGIATSTEILHQSLDKSTIALLRIEKFKLEQSGVWFNRVVEKVFLDSTSTLKFGHLPFKFLMDHFYLYDYSMGKVTASLKVKIYFFFFFCHLILMTMLFSPVSMH